MPKPRLKLLHEKMIDQEFERYYNEINIKKAPRDV